MTDDNGNHAAWLRITEHVDLTVTELDGSNPYMAEALMIQTQGVWPNGKGPAVYIEDGIGSENAARLIAAAPELLAALERSLQYIIVAHRDGLDSGLSKETLALAQTDFEMVSAALAKARE